MHSAPTLNHQVRNIWQAQKSLIQRLVHDSNNVLGAVQGYVSLFDIATDKTEQMDKFLPSMQEALTEGIRRNKSLAFYYRQSLPMVMNVDPIELARKTIDQFVSANSFPIDLLVTDEISTLPLEEPNYDTLIGHICFLLQSAASGSAAIKITSVDLDDDQISTFVMGSEPGKYLSAVIELSVSNLDGNVGQFLQPYQMAVPQSNGLGVADIIPIIANHRGNLDLQLAKDRLTMTVYLPGT